MDAIQGDFRGVRWPLLVASIALLPVALLGGYAVLAGSHALALQVARTLDATSRSVVARVGGELRLRSETVGVLARDHDLGEACRARDPAKVRRRLAELVEAATDLERAFVTDPAGVLWADWPEAPTSLGVDFSHRDWYRGVTSSRSTYISEVYRRAAPPAVNLVAIAAPIPGPAGTQEDVLGYLVAQVTLARLAPAETDPGTPGIPIVTLLDPTGTIASRPTLDLAARDHDELASAVPVVEALAGRTWRGRFHCPIVGGETIASAYPCRVGGRDWAVLVQLPRAEAEADAVSLARGLGVAGFLAASLVAGFALMLTRALDRLARIHRRLGLSHRDLERRMEESLAELERKEQMLQHARKMELIGQMAGGVAHDFGNVMSLVLGHADMLLEELPAEDPRHRDVETIRMAGERGARLTRQLLDISRRRSTPPVDLDLGTVLRSMEDLLTRLAGTGVEVELRVQEGLAAIRAVPDQVEQVVMNLVVNAKDAMPDGGRLSVRVSNHELVRPGLDVLGPLPAGKYVLLEVEDDGIGMDEEVQHRIFEPFFTTKAEGLGTGLGLSTVFAIVSQSGGALRVASRKGEGTCFSVYFPALDRDSGASVPAARDPLPDAPAAPGTILVVDDEGDLRALTAKVLERNGYRVTALPDAASTLTWLETAPRPPDLLCVDILLPEVDGISLVRRVRSRYPDLPVLYVSGCAPAQWKGDLHPDAVGDFLEKPVRPRELVSKVRELLGSTARPASPAGPQD